MPGVIIEAKKLQQEINKKKKNKKHRGKLLPNPIKFFLGEVLSRRKIKRPAALVAEIGVSQPAVSGWKSVQKKHFKVCVYITQTVSNPYLPLFLHLPLSFPPSCSHPYSHTLTHSVNVISVG